jgi:hypothetical protein
MIRPIPSRILRSSAQVEVCTGVDLYQNPAIEEYTVHHVHLQPTDRVVKSPTNTDCQLDSVLFVDARRSYPALDWDALLRESQENGGDLKVTVNGVRYTVITVDKLMGDTDKLHHWEIGVA